MEWVDHSFDHFLFELEPDSSIVTPVSILPNHTVHSNKNQVWIMSLGANNSRVVAYQICEVLPLIM
jgi:hypothetical protein